MNRTSVRLSVCLLLICCALPLVAQNSASTESVIPAMVKFTGTMNDVNGKPLTGTVGVTFLLYKEQSGGAPLWMETQNVQADKNGHYSVMLGSASGHGLPAESFAAGEARWLGVQPSGQAEQARVVLVSVPYALKALDAETLGGKPASAFMAAPPAGSKENPQGPLADQSNELSCSSSSACKTGFVPLFSSNGGAAKVNDSIITQSGSTVSVAGAENVTGNITSSGNLNAAGSVNASSVGANAVAANAVAANIITAGTSGNVIVATMTGNTAQTAAVTGTATATGIGNTYGVAGYSSTSGGGVGVFGQSPGSGVYGTGGVGVFGTGSAYGFQTDSNVNQARTAGGWVKAMVEVNASVAPYSIMRCFNSYLSGAAASTPPCGINFTEMQQGLWLLDFGFEVDDRFVSATSAGSISTLVTACTSDTCGGPTINQVLVSTIDTFGSGSGGYFYLIVY